MSHTKSSWPPYLRSIKATSRTTTSNKGCYQKNTQKIKTLVAQQEGVLPHLLRYYIYSNYELDKLQIVEQTGYAESLPSVRQFAVYEFFSITLQKNKKKIFLLCYKFSHSSLPL